MREGPSADDPTDSQNTFILGMCVILLSRGGYLQRNEIDRQGKTACPAKGDIGSADNSARECKNRLSTNDQSLG